MDFGEEVTEHRFAYECEDGNFYFANHNNFLFLFSEQEKIEYGIIKDKPKKEKAPREDWSIDDAEVGDTLIDEMGKEFLILGKEDNYRRFKTLHKDQEVYGYYDSFGYFDLVKKK